MTTDVPVWLGLTLYAGLVIAFLAAWAISTYGSALLVRSRTLSGYALVSGGLLLAPAAIGISAVIAAPHALPERAAEAGGAAPAQGCTCATVPAPEGKCP